MSEENKKYICHLYKYSEYEGRTEDGLTYYRKEKDIYESKTFKTEDEAIKAGEQNTEGCMDLFYQVEEVKS